MTTTSGPLQGIRVVEVGGIGASPFCSMLLTDMGAEVIRVDRPGVASSDDDLMIGPGQVMGRGRRALIGLDLKDPYGREALLTLLRKADVMTEAFRPGVAERLGIGPETVHEVNPRLIYGRMTGWGREGPLADVPGHDINYISLAGALRPMGRASAPPAPPLALVGDMGGGGMLLAFGITCALVERDRSGMGQIVDAAMVDGAALLMAAFWGHRAAGRWHDERESNLVDGGAPFYDTYECRDGGYIALGALEPQFYAELQELLELPANLDRMNREEWPRLRSMMRERFITRPLDEWCELLEGTDACASPVVDFEGALSHPHNRHRQTFIEIADVQQPAPAPRFSRTPGKATPPPEPSAGTDDVLRDWGLTDETIDELRTAGALE